MLNLILIFIIIVLLLVIAWFLWKSGFLMEAEKPISIIDNPNVNMRERKAVLKWLERCREEGKLSREEFKHLNSLLEKP